MRPIGAAVTALALAATAAAQPPKPHVYDAVHVLCIGIDEYQAVKKATPGAEKDAREFGKLMAGGFGYTPTELIGPDATKASIEKKVAGYAKTLGENDALIIFFAGHGGVLKLPHPEVGRAGFLVPYDADLDVKSDADPAKWRGAAIDMRWLLDQTRGMKAKHVLVVADACSSGFMTQSGARGDFGERYALHNLMTEPSRTAFTAATDSEQAIPDRKGEHGLFTAAVLKALREAVKRQEAVCVSDLLVPVRDEVAAASNRTMTPQLGRFGDGNGEFVFIPRRLDPGVVRQAVADLRQARDNRGKGGRGFGPFNGMAERTLERGNLTVKVGQVIEAFEAPEYRYGDDAVRKGREWQERAARLEQAADLGDPLAMAALHYYCAKGLGREPDPKEAYRWAVRAHETGTPAGQHVIGRCLTNGVGVTRNERDGLRMIREAAEARTPFPISLIQQGVDRIARGDDQAGLRSWELATKAGVRMGHYYAAAYHMAQLPELGPLGHVKKDREKAVAALLPAAEAGLADAQLLLAGLYAYEPPDKTAAAGWLTKAAENGDATAQGYLAQELIGLSVSGGPLPFALGLRPDFRAGRRWAQLSADRDNTQGHLGLALLYERDWPGQPSDAALAIRHCDRAIGNNAAAAMSLKSMWLFKGDLVKKDVDESFRLARRAAELGDTCGHALAGAHYLGGQEAGEEYRGLYHTTVAAANGDAVAIRTVRSLYTRHLKTNFQDGPKRAFWGRSRPSTRTSTPSSCGSASRRPRSDPARPPR